MSHTKFLAFLILRGPIRFVLGLIGSTSLLTGLVLIVLSLLNGGLGRGLLGVALVVVWWLVIYSLFTYDRAILRRTPAGNTFHLMS